MHKQVNRQTDDIGMHAYSVVATIVDCMPLQGSLGIVCTYRIWVLDQRLQFASHNDLSTA